MEGLGCIVSIILAFFYLLILLILLLQSLLTTTNGTADLLLRLSQLLLTLVAMAQAVLDASGKKK